MVALLAVAGILVAPPAFGSRLLRCELELITGCCYESEDSSDARIQGACCCEVRDVTGTGLDGLAPAIEPSPQTYVAPEPPRRTPRRATRPEADRSSGLDCEAPRQGASLLAQHTSLVV